MITILVVEDDAKLNKIVCAHLNEQGYNAVPCQGALEAFDKMIDTKADLIISDIMMPEIDGFRFASLVREQNTVIPILFMTARDDISAKQKGFRIGIDDYMVKPVDMEELTLRIGALLRRANIANEKKLVAGSLTLNADERSAELAGIPVPLTVKEFDVLFKLLSYPKKTFTRNQLMDDIWGLETNTTTRSVDVYITKLREKFAPCPDFEIITVHGLGYKAVLK
ncbi:MAG: response regulator transcription factor [Spirochaetaceae bacterium]|jgi:DNA-binding response OmpR family regulator|nr:response regulator transcription factor [Spirochaetaceae bacterium]